MFELRKNVIEFLKSDKALVWHVNAKVDIFCKIEQNPKEYYYKSSLTFYQTLREFMDRVI